MLLTIIKKHENVFFSCKLSLKNYIPQNEDTGLDRLIIEIFFLLLVHVCPKLEDEINTQQNQYYCPLLLLKLVIHVLNF